MGLKNSKDTSCTLSRYLFVSFQNVLSFIVLERFYFGLLRKQKFAEKKEKNNLISSQRLLD